VIDGQLATAGSSDHGPDRWPAIISHEAEVIDCASGYRLTISRSIQEYIAFQRPGAGNRAVEVTGYSSKTMAGLRPAFSAYVRRGTP
jgi:hypothetical protein